MFNYTKKQCSSPRARNANKIIRNIPKLELKNQIFEDLKHQLYSIKENNNYNEENVITHENYEENEKNKANREKLKNNLKKILEKQDSYNPKTPRQTPRKCNSNDNNNNKKKDQLEGLNQPIISLSPEHPKIAQKLLLAKTATKTAKATKTRQEASIEQHQKRFQKKNQLLKKGKQK